MKKLFPILIATMFINISLLLAQTNKPSLLYIVYSHSKTIRTNHLLIGPFDIEKMELPPKSEAVKTLGAFAEDGVMVITAKDSVSLLTLTNLFDQFKIENQFRNLPINIDSALVNNGSDLIAAKNVISSVRVNREKNYIEIITKLKHPIKRDKSHRIQ